MKLISIQFNGENSDINLDNPINIAIPLNFSGDQPNAYGVGKAVSTPCEAEDIIGDTRLGGSCNFEKVEFIPHCNGTHTECVGHLTKERIFVHECLKDAFIPAVLISVSPESENETNESYSIKLNENDKLITRKSLENALQNLKSENPQYFLKNLPALIIRTLPNEIGKLSKTYLKEIPPFFSTEAIEFIRELETEHLLVDLPSIDRIFDEGKLSNHRIFWNIEQGKQETNDKSLIYNTITELIYVPDKIKDGAYLLNLQIAPFMSDASPSRPVLFELKQ